MLLKIKQSMCYNFSNSYKHSIFRIVWTRKTLFMEEKKITLPFFNRKKRKRDKEKEKDLSIWISQMNASNALSPNRNECIVEREGGEGMKGRECSRLEFPPFIGNVRGIRGKWILAKCYYKFYLSRWKQ